MKIPRDKTGREILVGDTIKLFHFIGARRKKHYMYKYVSEIVKLGGSDFYKVMHLNPKGEYFHIPLNCAFHSDIEIVQGYDEKGISFDERERVK